MNGDEMSMLRFISRMRDACRLIHKRARYFCGLISKTTRSSCGGESRKVKICFRRDSSVTCLAIQDNFSPFVSISTAEFLIIF